MCAMLLGMDLILFSEILSANQYNLIGCSSKKEKKLDGNSGGEEYLQKE